MKKIGKTKIKKNNGLTHCFHFDFAGVEIQCIGHFKLLFCLLRLEDCAKLQQFALDVSKFM